MKTIVTASALFLVTGVLAACGEASSVGSPDEAPTPKEKPAAAPPPMKCDRMVGMSDDYVVPPDGADAPEELGKSYMKSGDTVEVMSESDGVATVYVVDKSGDESVAVIEALRSNQGWYIDSVESCER